MTSSFPDKLRRAALVYRTRGWRSLLRTIVSSGWIKPMRSRAAYRRCKNRYPQHILFIAAFAKSGSSWYANLLADVLGFFQFNPMKWPLGGEVPHWFDVYPGLFDEYRDRLALVKNHTWGFPENARRLETDYREKYLITVRDPRDALISSYWYVRNLPHHWEYRKAQSRDLHAYITYKLESGEYEAEYVNWLRMWLDHRDPERSMIVRYEDLLEDPEREIKKTLEYLNMDIVDNEAIRQSVYRNSFTSKSGRSRGEEDTSSFMRKAVAEEWKQVMDERQKTLAAAAGPDVLERLGYAIT